MPNKKTYQTARGVRDILPAEQPYWQQLRKACESVMDSLGISRIDLPTFENVEIYSRGIGTDTDIVQKEMYLLEKTAEKEDKEIYALRPEGTAGAARAYIQNGMGSWPQPVKLYYMGPMYRHERPQKGRYREFFQFGLEIFGDSTAKADYLAIMSAWQILKKVGLKDLIVYTNSIGCPKCRPKYLAKLKKFLKDNNNKLCDDCKKRTESNPLRALDCKIEACQKIILDAPNVLDTLCEECNLHFQNTLEYLDYFGIRYDLDSKLVRGLDYYSRTVFEIAEAKDKSRSGSIVGGGRYDGLIEILGGSPTPAVGYSFGMDRIVTLMKEQGIKPEKSRGVEVCILQLGEKAKDVSKEIYDKLSENDVNVYFVPSNDSLRSQLRQASKLGATYAVIIGQKEAFKDEIILRDLRVSSQETIPSKGIAEEVKKRLLK